MLGRVFSNLVGPRLASTLYSVAVLVGVRLHVKSIGNHPPHAQYGNEQASGLHCAFFSLFRCLFSSFSD